MNSLWNRLNDDLKKALKEKNEQTLSTLRLVLAELKNKMIELKEKDSLPDERVAEVLQSAIKKRKESSALYEQGNRPELAQKEKAEIEIIEKYLPEQMSQEKIEKIVKEVISSIDSPNMSDFGRIMSQVMVKTKGQADGQAVSEKVKKLLSS